MTSPSLFETFALLVVVVLAFYTTMNLWKRWRRLSRLEAELRAMKRRNDARARFLVHWAQERRLKHDV